MGEKGAGGITTIIINNFFSSFFVLLFFSPLFVFLSPFQSASSVDAIVSDSLAFDRHGWLGVKHHVTYSRLSQMKVLIAAAAGDADTNIAYNIKDAELS